MIRQSAFPPWEHLQRTLWTKLRHAAIVLLVAVAVATFREGLSMYAYSVKLAVNG